MKHWFFDVGANVGQTFDDFLLKTSEFNNWEVVCFEPSPRHLAGLLEKAAAVSDRFHVTVCPIAISETAGLKILHEKEDPRGDSLYEHLWQHGYVKNLEGKYGVLAWCAKLSEVILSLTAPEDRVVVKLDCEGAEYGILRELLESPDAFARVARLMVEFHRTGSDDGSARVEEVRLYEHYKKIGRPFEIWPY